MNTGQAHLIVSYWKIEALKIYGSKSDEGNFKDASLIPMANIQLVKDNITDEIKVYSVKNPFLCVVFADSTTTLQSTDNRCCGMPH